MDSCALTKTFMQTVCAFIFQSHLSAISKGTHIVITHTPPILPRSSEGFREKKPLIEAMRSAGTLLSVSGHCHWAHGLYHSAKGKIPCVVASVCDSKWLSMRNLLAGPSGKRGDEEGDKMYGGYNIRFPIIVCDINVPPPSTSAKWSIKGVTSLTASGGIEKKKKKEEKPKPTLLFFGPPTDIPAVSRLVPLLSDKYDVFHFDEASEAIAEIEARKENFSACIAKLGSRGNLGVDVVQALRQRKNGEKTFVVIHSATAVQSERTRNNLAPIVDLIVDHSSEEKMLQVLLN